MEGETVPTEVCSDVEKELRAIEVLKPLFATQKEGATPQERVQPFLQEKWKIGKEANPCQNLFSIKRHK